MTAKLKALDEMGKTTDRLEALKISPENRINPLL